MKKEDLFASLENIDANFIEEAENYHGSKLNNPLFMYIGMAASVLVVACVAGLFLFLNNREEAVVQTDIERMTIIETVTYGTGATEVSKETFNAREDRIKMIKALGSEIPLDAVLVGLTPSDSEYLNGYIGYYIPEDQDAWKNAINNTMKHVRDKKYDIFPEEAILPIVVLWEHDGIRDYWSLGVDGSLWGCHHTDDTEPYTKNYVAPEDAVELVSLLKQTYEFFEISPVRPEQLGEITYAELTVKGKTYTLDDPVKLKYLENTLKKGKRKGASGCPFAGLKLRFADGTAITICIAWDGCGVWHSDGMYFRYGNSDDAKSVFALFGIDLYQLPKSN